MALERLSLGSGPAEGGDTAASASASAGVDEGSKAARLPRWTRQEILVLIQGKRVAENRVRRGRGSASASAFGAGQMEPKWASVSSYCKKHGVNRGPVQCRKRWSNLAGDFKKIKEWELRKAMDGTESFWVMRNDLRRERKLPGFFDREVYDILDGADGHVEVGSGLSFAPPPDREPEPEAVFGRSAGADERMLSDFEHSGQSPDPHKDDPVHDVPTPVPISVGEKESETQESPDQGANNEERIDLDVPENETPQEEKKRKRSEGDDEEGEEEATNPHYHLIQALENNGKLLCSHLESQNTHLRLDREQRNNHANSLITVLNKLADALERIADKL